MSARAWTLFAATSVLWGLPYLFFKIAVVMSAALESPRRTSGTR
jgi:hypothetical protein